MDILAADHLHLRSHGSQLPYLTLVSVLFPFFAFPFLFCRLLLSFPFLSSPFLDLTGPLPSPYLVSASLRLTFNGQAGYRLMHAEHEHSF
jgi:hypothetical protein